MTHDQDLARQLGETLQRRADALHDTPLDLLAVRGRATSIRRRRTAVAGVAAAAVIAAVVVPLSLLPTGDGRGLDLQPAETITPIPEPVPLDPRSAPEGAAPRVPYLVVDAKQLVTPAATYDLPEAYLQIVPDGDGGWVALAQGAPDIGITVEMLDGDFRVTDGAGGPARGLAVREDGGRVAFTQYDGAGRWTLLTTALPRVADYTYTDVATRTSEEAVHRPLGYVSDDSVVVEANDPDTGQLSYRVVAADGTMTEFGGFNRVVSASSVTGLVAGQTEYTGDDSCSAVLDPLSADQDLEWETCDHQLGDFSPDGRFIVGLADYSDSLGSPSVGILDATTGEPVVDFVSGNDVRSAAAVSDVVWEDATTLLATVTQRNEQYVVRATIDGRVERVVGPAPAQMSTEYRFPTHLVG
ncbi:hypothetical protein [Nocardioides sp. Soil805]|uniref:hypothetical protein n=1 Tax=Nocardioides sp. Soil805 TaxID=1736416 RepID=UPI0007038251|nr:hypothetical protein [Nocardioides sp. Soil805]KRF35278.1 hypothetical protein ASG94_14340 [Nocardioides sp. Soil805]